MSSVQTQSMQGVPALQPSELEIVPGEATSATRQAINRYFRNKPAAVGLANQGDDKHGEPLQLVGVHNALSVKVNREEP